MNSSVWPAGAAKNGCKKTENRYKIHNYKIEQALMSVLSDLVSLRINMDIKLWVWPVGPNVEFSCLKTKRKVQMAPTSSKGQPQVFGNRFAKPMGDIMMTPPIFTHGQWVWRATHPTR